MREQPVVVIGGGLGGLAAAIHLAAAGRQVVLVERGPQLGGKLNQVVASGFRFDTGPSLLTMPWVLRDLCAVAGTRLEDELEIIALDPICRYRWRDGTQIDITPNLPQLVGALDSLHAGDGAALLRFLAYSSRMYHATAGPFLERPFTGIGDMLNPQLVRDSLAIDPFRTVSQAVASFFGDNHTRQVFERYATYNGSSPFRAPATFNQIAYIELTQAAWHVRGGMYRIAEMLERLAKRLGVAIFTNCAAREIEVIGGQARAVLLEDGTRLAASAVVANIDPQYVYRQLIRGAARTADRLGQRELSYSGFVLLLGVQGEYPALAHHNIFFADDYRREFGAIVDKRVPYPDPTIYVSAPSIADPQLAPPGHTNLFVLVNAPHTNDRVHWAREAQPYRDLVVRKLETMGLADLSARIVFEEIWTPQTIAERYNAPAGAIYGLASNTPWSAFLRPPQRAPGIGGLVFAGGGTHPGGGIPLVLLSGRAAAQHTLAG